MNSKDKLDLDNLFLIISSSAFRLRKKVPNFDGQAYWQPIKKTLQDFDDKHPFPNIKFKPMNQEVIDELSELPESDTNGNMIEQNHFIKQLVNIPIKSDHMVTFRKILQIALNIGQWKVAPIESLDILFMEHKMRYIDTYLDRKDIQILSDAITDELSMYFRRNVLPYC